MEKLTIEEVKKIAKENYNKGGDGVIECWDDKDIQEWLDGTGIWEGSGKGTKTKLLKMFKDWHEHSEDIKGW